jgi:hypothetical protein
VERTGRWDDAIALSTDLLDRAGPSPASRLCTLIRLVRWRPRGRPRGLDVPRRGVDDADATGGRSSRCRPTGPGRGVLAAGRSGEARREAELADDVCANGRRLAPRRGRDVVGRTGSSRPVRGEVAEP